VKQRYLLGLFFPVEILRDINSEMLHGIKILRLSFSNLTFLIVLDRLNSRGFKINTEIQKTQGIKSRDLILRFEL